jgi:hypothetical protein
VSNYVGTLNVFTAEYAENAEISLYFSLRTLRSPR